MPIRAKNAGVCVFCMNSWLLIRFDCFLGLGLHAVLPGGNFLSLHVFPIASSPSLNVVPRVSRFQFHRWYIKFVFACERLPTIK